MTKRPTKSDLAEVAAGKGSKRDKAEAAMGDPSGTARKKHRKRSKKA